MTYRQLSPEERYMLAALSKQGFNKSQIARALGRHRSTVGREMRGGLTTFFTMAYIVVLNPLIIGTVKDADGQYIGGGTDPGLSIAKVAVAQGMRPLRADEPGLPRFIDPTRPISTARSRPVA